MNKITLLAVLWFIVSQSYAQDMLYFKGSSSPVRATVERKNALYLWYRRYPDAAKNGITDKRLIDSIIYENGTTEYFTRRRAGSEPEKRESYTDWKDNIVWAGLGRYKLERDPFLKTYVVNAKDFEPVFAVLFSYEHFLSTSGLVLRWGPISG
ncbi:hypothetical protein [Niabella soli]|uniref:Uncharacterized protein n=1 Tax=Niabella soli DSM 19437 TaxID=929713 RepID=W0F7T9_9BACT|nr:hypothetical protein [Niabella soli]AHF17416.1 hypothetical protein NIASO_07120 [Niabella soli DSM 19437]